MLIAAGECIGICVLKGRIRDLPFRYTIKKRQWILPLSVITIVTVQLIPQREFLPHGARGYLHAGKAACIWQTTYRSSP